MGNGKYANDWPWAFTHTETEHCIAGADLEWFPQYLPAVPLLALGHLLFEVLVFSEPDPSALGERDRDRHPGLGDQDAGKICCYRYRRRLGKRHRSLLRVGLIQAVTHGVN